MAEFQLHRASKDDADRWNSFVESSNEGTLFHRLDFLAYHGDKFREYEHHIAISKGGSLYAIMPLAIIMENGDRIAKSPYGASYGGPVFLRPVTYSEAHHVVETTLNYLQSLGVVRVTLTLPLSILYRSFSETFRLVLLEHGFRCINRDICSVVPLQSETISSTISSRARNAVRKAQKMGVQAVRNAPLCDFWRVLERTYAKLQLSSTHTFSEFRWLHEKFPALVYADVAYHDGRPVAGIGYLVLNDRVNSSFYLCQDPEEQRLSALSLLIFQALEHSQNAGFRWFDFGTSSTKMQGRPNLFMFKEGFGAVGIFRETYSWATQIVIRTASHDCARLSVRSGS